MVFTLPGIVLDRACPSLWPFFLHECETRRIAGIQRLREFETWQHYSVTPTSGTDQPAPPVATADAGPAEIEAQTIIDDSAMVGDGTSVKDPGVGNYDDALCKPVLLTSVSITSTTANTNGYIA